MSPQSNAPAGGPSSNGPAKRPRSGRPASPAAAAPAARATARAGSSDADLRARLVELVAEFGGPAAAPVAPVPAADPERAALQAEVERLRALVGPDEQSYIKLRTDLWAARDAAIGAEMEAGQLRGRVHALESELVRARRDFRWLRKLVLKPVRRLKNVLAKV